MTYNLEFTFEELQDLMLVLGYADSAAKHIKDSDMRKTITKTYSSILLKTANIESEPIK